MLLYRVVFFLKAKIHQVIHPCPSGTQETPLCYSHIQYGSDSCHTVYTQEMNGTMLEHFFFQIEKISTSKFQKCHH